MSRLHAISDERCADLGLLCEGSGPDRYFTDTISASAGFLTEHWADVTEAAEFYHKHDDVVDSILTASHQDIIAMFPVHRYTIQRLLDVVWRMISDQYYAMIDNDAVLDA